jgi:mannan endo-1,4-beta-mannosidase
MRGPDRRYLLGLGRKALALGVLTMVSGCAEPASGSGRTEARPLAFEAEVGLTSGGAAVKADSGASAGEYLNFGAPSNALTVEGFVARQGTGLLLGALPYRFAGVNIYQANSVQNCSYTMGMGPALDQSLSRIGSGPRYAFRSWFFQRLATIDGNLDWTVFDHTLQVAADHGYRVIATLTNQWGSCETQPESNYKALPWYQGGYRRPDGTSPLSYRDYVARVVARYRDNPTIMSWQLVNEAEAADWRNGPCQESKAADALRSFTDDVGRLVKGIDPNHLVNLGSTGSGQCGMRGPDYQGVNASSANDWCEYHDYGRVAEAVPAALQVVLGECQALNKPTIVGETGISTAEAGGYAQRSRAFEAKFSAQFALGVAGELVWSWDLEGSSPTSYQTGPDDPTLGVVSRYAASVGGTAASPRCATPLPSVRYGKSIATVLVPRAGPYHVWSRLSSPSGMAAYSLQVDGKCPVAVTGHLSAGGWEWTTTSEGNPASGTVVYLSAGRHMIAMVGTQPGTELDRVEFLVDASCVPRLMGDSCVPPAGSG